MKTKDELILKALVKATYLGLFMNTLFPALLLVIAVIMFGGELTRDDGFVLYVPPHLTTLYYLLLAVSLVELVLALYIRMRLPAFLFKGIDLTSQDDFERVVFKQATTTYALNATYGIYGFVLMSLGASIEVMVLFVALSFIGYQVFRARKRSLEKLYSRFQFPDSREEDKREEL